MRRLAAVLAGLLMSAGIVLVGAPSASAASCDGTYTIVVGGFTDRDSTIFSGAGISQRVGYSAELNSQSARQGVDELNRLIRNQRAACPGQHVKAVGFSEGAAVLHIWVTENWKTFGNVNAVLIADPKRDPHGLGGPGLAGQAPSVIFGPIVGYPLVGVDSFFGNIPTVSLCTDDIICDEAAASGWIGYAQHKHTENYNFNVDVYSDNGVGQWFNGQYFPDK
ncbi:cutinase family protein [Amycolatopsis saalfeldensis]|uniref:Cutinase n=1 Tax=Amycolatopsis saalfeldensis TaxID=394193 RepID=A0A1H8UAA0_9PSEU|nr:cutinase family protein [Amycolatopsis saalfeldensis]SEP00192.1 cutinase [Amycolatopsis saalfeldensis]